MKTREEILAYGLTFTDTYVDTPFSDAEFSLSVPLTFKEISVASGFLYSIPILLSI